MPSILTPPGFGYYARARSIPARLPRANTRSNHHQLLISYRKVRATLNPRCLPANFQVEIRCPAPTRVCSPPGSFFGLIRTRLPGERTFERGRKRLRRYRKAAAVCQLKHRGSHQRGHHGHQNHNREQRGGDHPPLQADIEQDKLHQPRAFINPPMARASCGNSPLNRAAAQQATPLPNTAISTTSSVIPSSAGSMTSPKSVCKPE